MPKQIIWSALAESDLDGILEYLLKNWDQKVASNFIDLTENAIDQIAVNPRQYPIIYKIKVSENVCSQDTTLFFIEIQNHK